jgi:hypothetical protein
MKLASDYVLDNLVEISSADLAFLTLPSDSVSHNWLYFVVVVVVAVGKLESVFCFPAFP